MIHLLRSSGNTTLFFVLVSRTFMFAFFQVLVALILGSWVESTKYWLLSATLTNVVSIIILGVLLRKQGNSLLSLFRIKQESWKRDLMVFSGLAILSMFAVFIPSYFLQLWLWNDPQYTQDILFQPISENLSLFLFIAFPLSIGLAEIPTYFGFLMPAFKTNLKSNLLAILLPVLFLSVQHCTLPLIFDFSFVLFRGLVYLPFALIIGISIYKRPSLLPYFIILHVMLDVATAMMLWIK